MNIPLTTKFESEVVRAFRAKKLEAEEAELFDYERPLYRAVEKKKALWNPVAVHAFARGLLP